MSKHTPGPWTEHKWNSEEHQVSALGGTVALVSHSHSLITDEQADANATLIAAAPELLAACKLALDWHADGTPVEEMSSMEQTAINALEAAIRKAEGGKA